MQTSERVTSAWLRTSYINVIKINEILYRYISYANRNFSGVFPTFAEKVREVADCFYALLESILNSVLPN